jgi:hypothetical protein
MGLGDRWIAPAKRETNRFRDLMGLSTDPDRAPAVDYKEQTQLQLKKQAFDERMNRAKNGGHENASDMLMEKYNQRRPVNGPVRPETTPTEDLLMQKHHDRMRPVQGPMQEPMQGPDQFIGPMTKPIEPKVKKQKGQPKQTKKTKIIDPSDIKPEVPVNGGDKSNNSLKANAAIDYMKKDFEAFSKAGSQTVDKMSGDKNLRKELLGSATDAIPEGAKVAEQAFETAKTERTMGKIGGELLDDLGRGSKMMGGAKLGAYMAGGIAIADFLNPFSLGWND